jgi:drug/metabolite transporter (DMT)-like permease
MLCEAIYAVIAKRLSGQLSPRRITALINLCGLLLMTPAGLYAAWGFNFGAVPLSAWGLLVFYALAASVGTVWLWMTGLPGIPASHSGIFTVMAPISAVLVGVLALNEPFSATQGIALGLAVLGLGLVTSDKR